MNPSHSDVANDIVKTINNIPIYENSAIVYDIDGTLISMNGEPIMPIINTYHHAKSAGLTPVIITARPGSDENIRRTKEQLRSYGIIGYRYMYFLPQNKQDQAKFKLISRQNLHERGYQVVISIGDMPWDIGHYGGIGFRV
jgi:hypothetical protein